MSFSSNKLLTNKNFNQIESTREEEKQLSLLFQAVKLKELMKNDSIQYLYCLVN